MDSFKKFNENKLPDKSKFFSSLKIVALMKKNVKKPLIFGKYLK